MKLKKQGHQIYIKKKMRVKNHEKNLIKIYKLFSL